MIKINMSGVPSVTISAGDPLALQIVAYVRRLCTVSARHDEAKVLEGAYHAFKEHAPKQPAGETYVRGPKREERRAT